MGWLARPGQAALLPETLGYSIEIADVNGAFDGDSLETLFGPALGFERKK